MATMTVDTDIRIAPNAGLNVIPIGAINAMLLRLDPKNNG